jgi:hypothetical protein
MVTFGLDSNEVPMIKMPVGGGFDIITGVFTKGTRDETLLFGGFTNFTTLTGVSNSFKTTVMLSMISTVVDRLRYTSDADVIVFDTESNFDSYRVNELLKKKIKYSDPTTLPVTYLNVNSTDIHTFFDNFVAFMKNKLKNSNRNSIKLPMIKTVSGENVTLPYFTIGLIDTITQYGVSEGHLSTLTKNGSDSDKNRMSGVTDGGMRDKHFKAYFQLLLSSNTNLGLIVQTKTNIIKDVGYGLRPPKEFSSMSEDEVLTGLSQFTKFVTRSIIGFRSKSPLYNPSKTGTLYKTKKFKSPPNELRVVKAVTYRVKNGKSDRYIEVVVSENDGLLKELSEFHQIYTNKFGYRELQGNVRKDLIVYELELMPGVEFTLSEVRDKLDEDPLFARAVQITSELWQINELPVNNYEEYVTKPQEMYETIKELGFDWNRLLNTRNWWTPDHYKPGILKYLSVIDLIRMMKDGYRPWWYDTEGE